MLRPVTTRLTVTDHDRDAAGLTYVYPVVSRRAGGVSVGINLNPNNACNWRCVYCQVPELVKGAAPPIDEDRLEAELRGMLGEARREAWLAQHVADPAHRQLVDVAFSGNGEPTTSHQLDSIVARVLVVLDELGLGGLHKVLITNGSMMHRAEVLRAVERLGAAGGEVWLKLDRATAEGRRRYNDAASSIDAARQGLRACAARCRTRIQTCMLAIDDEPPPEDELRAYIDFLAEEREAGTPLADVLLYGLARPSMQPDGQRLSPLPVAWLEAFAERIRGVGLAVVVRP